MVLNLRTIRVVCICNLSRLECFGKSAIYGNTYVGVHYVPFSVHFQMIIKILRSVSLTDLKVLGGLP